MSKPNCGLKTTGAKKELPEARGPRGAEDTFTFRERLDEQGSFEPLDGHLYSEAKVASLPVFRPAVRRTILVVPVQTLHMFRVSKFVVPN